MDINSGEAWRRLHGGFEVVCYEGPANAETAQGAIMYIAAPVLLSNM